MAESICQCGHPKGLHPLGDATKQKRMRAARKRCSVTGCLCREYRFDYRDYEMPAVTNING
jgi:hypothetical protein